MYAKDLERAKLCDTLGLHSKSQQQVPQFPNFDKMVVILIF